MAAERHAPQQRYVFTMVRLFKSEILGTGSYGAVCKAKCDQLPCAAKLLYPVLFQMQTHADPGNDHRHPFRRFELECQFLSHVNHPNIVQYLGISRDPETNTPVLLMELMDESLTHFLESLPGDLPHHTQVSLSYDIAQALAFLHSNGIIHRDLSSNNVLLLASTRAKVTDFGMSKFINKRLGTMTTCPGTPAFMSPEALNKPPVYTEKLDSFSFGVLLLQIATRQFPEPTDRFKMRQLVDPRFPNEIIHANVPVPELERRQAHINLITQDHLLLPTALHCLKDEDSKRPTAVQLCQTLTALKRLAWYKEIPQQNLRQLLTEKDAQLHAKDEQIIAKDKQLQAKEELIQAKEEQIQAKEEQIQINRHTIEQKHIELQEKKTELVLVNQAIQALRHEMGTKNQQLKTLHRKLVSNERNCAALQETIEQRDKEVSELKQAQVTNEQDLLTQIQSKEENYAALQETVQQRDRKVNELKQALASKSKNEQDLMTQMQSSEQNCAALQQTIQEQDRKVREMKQVVKSKNKKEMDLIIQMQSIEENCATLKETIQQQDEELCVLKQALASKSTNEQDLASHVQSTEENCAALQQIIMERDREMNELKQDLASRSKNEQDLITQMQLSEENYATLQQTIQQRDKEVSEFRQTLASKNEQDLTIRMHHVIALQDEKQEPPSTRPVIVGRSQFLPDLPADIEYGSSCLIGDKTYFKSFSNSTIYEFSTNQWSKLPPCTKRWCTIVNVDDKLTTVGGESQSSSPSNKIYSYIDNQWVKHFPPMPTKRRSPTAVYANNILIVTGGRNAELLSTIEILNTVSRQWSSVSSLPVGMCYLSATICEDNMYIHPRTIDQEKNSVYKCSLEQLVQSRPRSGLWKKIPSLPVSYSSLVTVNHHVLAVGGWEANDRTTNIIYQYVNNLWTAVNHMISPRSAPATAVLHDNKLMVVGGWGAYRQCELATIL